MIGKLILIGVAIAAIAYFYPHLIPDVSVDRSMVQTTTEGVRDAADKIDDIDDETQDPAGDPFGTITGVLDVLTSPGSDTQSLEFESLRLEMNENADGTITIVYEDTLEQTDQVTLEISDSRGQIFSGQCQCSTLTTPDLEVADDSVTVSVSVSHQEHGNVQFAREYDVQ